jgi:hypothetical protein
MQHPKEFSSPQSAASSLTHGFDAREAAMVAAVLA